jgi:Tol biopolymer transport system component
MRCHEKPAVFLGVSPAGYVHSSGTRSLSDWGGTAEFGIKKLLFQADSPRGYISVLDQQSKKPKLVARGVMAVWSPDGQKIAYCTPEPFVVAIKGTTQVILGQMKVMSADGSGTKQLTDVPGGACPIDWSPDGKRIAFTAGSGEHGLVALAPGGNEVGSMVSGNAGRWSPDGKKMLFWKRPKDPKSSGSIWLVGDGSEPRKVIDDSSLGVCPSWNPYTQSILFSSDREHKGKYEVLRVNLDGSGLETFATDSKYSLSCPLMSPDGKYLVVDVYKHDFDDSTIMVLDLTTRAETAIAHGRNPQII